MSESSDVAFSLNVLQTIYEIERYFFPTHYVEYPSIRYFEQNGFAMIFRPSILVWYRYVFCITAASSVLIPIRCALLSSELLRLTHVSFRWPSVHSSSAWLIWKYMTVTYNSCVILVTDRELWRSHGCDEDCLLAGNTVQFDSRSCIRQQGNLVTPWSLAEDPTCIRRGIAYNLTKWRKKVSEM